MKWVLFITFLAYSDMHEIHYNSLEECWRSEYLINKSDNFDAVCYLNGNQPQITSYIDPSLIDNLTYLID